MINLELHSYTSIGVKTNSVSPKSGFISALNYIFNRIKNTEVSNQMQTELYEGEEILNQFRPARSSVLLLDYLMSFAIIAVSVVASAGLVTYFDGIPIIGDYIGSSLIIAIGLILAIPGLIAAEIKVRGNTYYLTNQRIIHEYKFLKYNSKIIKFNRITNISSERSLIDRIFRTGKIKIKTAGTKEAEMTIRKIKNHTKIEKQISQSIEASGPSPTTTGESNGNYQNNRNNNQRQNNL